MLQALRNFWNYLSTPRRTVLSVVDELIAGLEDGTVVLPGPSWGQGQLAPQNPPSERVLRRLKMLVYREVRYGYSKWPRQILSVLLLGIRSRIRRLMERHNIDWSVYQEIKYRCRRWYRRHGPPQRPEQQPPTPGVPRRRKPKD